MRVDSPYIGYWMATQYGSTGRRFNTRLVLAPNGFYQRWTSQDSGAERAERGIWQHRKDDAEEVISFRPDVSDELDWTRDTYRVLSIKSCEDSNCLLVLRWAGLGSRNLPDVFYRVHDERFEPHLFAGTAAGELVDLIDDAGRTVGVVTRAEMRARRLPHRCTYVLVFNRRGELFVHLRTPTKDVYPGRWDVAIGGVLLAGETFDQGAAREIREELGVDGSADELFPFHYADAATVVQARVYRMRHDGPFQLQAEEIVRGEFLPWAAVRERMAAEPFCPDGAAVLDEYGRWARQAEE